MIRTKEIVLNLKAETEIKVEIETQTIAKQTSQEIRIRKTNQEVKSRVMTEKTITQEENVEDLTRIRSQILIEQTEARMALNQMILLQNQITKSQGINARTPFRQ